MLTTRFFTYRLTGVFLFKHVRQHDLDPFIGSFLSQRETKLNRAGMQLLMMLQ
jgi:hypothetical protein